MRYSEGMDDALNALPDALRALVAGYMASAGVDFGSEAAMHSRCEWHSMQLAHYIDTAYVMEVDEDGEELWPVPRRTWTPFRWERGEVPEVLAGDEVAVGHVVCAVEWDGETYEIDLTAAQFPQLGWTGPRVRAL